MNFCVATGHVFTISWQCVNTSDMLQKISCDTYVNYFIILLIFTCWIPSRHETIARLFTVSYKIKLSTDTSQFCQIVIVSPCSQATETEGIRDNAYVSCRNQNIRLQNHMSVLFIMLLISTVIVRNGCSCSALYSVRRKKLKIESCACLLACYNHANGKRTLQRWRATGRGCISMPACQQSIIVQLTGAAGWYGSL